jgi:hypothetical protein
MRIANGATSVFQIHLFESLRTPVGLAEYPEHSKTGRRGYFGKFSSVVESPQKQNSEPREDSILRACTQSAQSPVRARNKSDVGSVVTLKAYRSKAVSSDAKGVAQNAHLSARLIAPT